MELQSSTSSAAQYDVVVVGYGAAGAMAAIEAWDAGARVLLIEKMAQPGGISILSAGGVRIAFDADQGLAYLRETCGGRTPDDLLQALAQGMHAVPEQLRRLARVNGAQISVEPAAGNYPFAGCDALGYAEVADIPGFAQDPAGWLHARPFRPGCLLFKLLLDNVEHRRRQGRLDVWLSTPADRLMKDAHGRVTGLRVQHGGRAVTVHAQGGVILACGGFEADEEMKRQYLPAMPVLAGSFAGNTGDGIRMAQAVGADLWHMWHFHGPYGMRHSDPAYPFGLYVKALPMWTPERPTRRPLPVMPWIVVDRRGRRYIDEYPPYMSDTGVRQFDFFDPQAHAHTRLPSFMVFDEAGRRMYSMGRAITNDPQHWYDWSEDNLAEVESGMLQRADSIAALARAAGIDAAALEATVATWNAACAAGRDDAFGRRPETMAPIVEGPFYLAELWPVVINTQGGPVHDARQRVLDPFGDPIEGLYAAGEMGSVFGHVYMAGGNLAECFVGGAAAGREAAQRSLPARQRNAA
ncbi:FAD-binding protein [Variovorax sp. KK3]|uniref:FAD-dependent oxidoreductase n=1 Tax=Variovorax sp. KK3 TaxID=1855728 RepID=UPI00097C10B9|nr:FAD-binding protein [Variovorax sp. KK3]